MSNKLEKIIAHYEAEYAALTAQIDECIEDAEYKMAHRLNKGLTLVGQKLQTLHNLQDKFYDDKAVIARLEARLAKMLDDEAEVKNSSYMQLHLQKQIAEQEQEIKAAQEAQKLIPIISKKSVLQDTLLKLLVGEIPQFELMIDDEQLLYCNIRLVRKTLIISIPDVRWHRRNGLFRKKQFKHLQRLGFKLYDDKNTLMAFLPYRSLEELVVVKSVLSQVVFEVFYFKEFRGQAFVKYVE